MNILIIHNYYKQRGGEDAVFENEAAALKEAGHNVITYTRHNDEIDNHSTFHKGLFFFRSLYNRSIGKEIKKIILENNIEIAHIHNVFPLISPSIYRILKKNNVRIVQTIHNYRFLCPNGLFYHNGKNCTFCKGRSTWKCVIHKCYRNSYIQSFLYSLIVKKNQKLFRHYIDGYIALTEFSKKLFIDAGYNKDRFFIKDNGFKSNKLKRKKSKGYFLFLGRISEEKGLRFLLESFSKLEEYKLVIAGTGPELEILKDECSLTNVRFTGFVDGEEKAKLLSEAAGLIVPSLWFENYPVSIVEAFNYGIPVIGSSIGGIPYIVENNKTGLIFKVNDFDDFKRCLVKINKDNTLREKLGSNAQKYFDEKMNMTNNVKRLEEIYSRVLENNKVNVGGILFDNVNMDQAVEIMEKRISGYNGKGSSLLGVANQDSIARSLKVKEFNIDEINKSFLIIPDGNSIVVASKILDTPLKERVAGPDLMDKFMEVSASKGYRNYLLGAGDGVAERLADILTKKYPGLIISGIYAPPFGDFSDKENRKIIKQVNDSKSDVLWVSFGCPKQEIWIINNKEKLNVPISAGIGAAFDFLSGNKKRAPGILQKAGLEWFYRFLQEPSRLWKRYFIGGLRFLIIILKQRVDRNKK